LRRQLVKQYLLLAPGHAAPEQDDGIQHLGGFGGYVGFK